MCQLTHKNPSLFSGVLTYTQKPSLFSGVPTYTQKPLSLLWCANLHTKTLSLLWCANLHTKTLSLLWCANLHTKTLSLLWCASLYTKPSLSLLSCSAIVSSFFLLLYRGVMGNGVGGSGRFYQPDEERELIIFLTPSMVHAWTHRENLDEPRTPFHYLPL